MMHVRESLRSRGRGRDAGEMKLAAYDRIGRGYSSCRRTDPRIAALIDGALGEAQTVLNVGAGAGSYEPSERDVVAAEPSAEMIAQRPPGSAPVLRATAEDLPLDDASFDVAMAVFSDHHWRDRATGLREITAMSALRRDLDSGQWDERNASLLDRTELDVGLRLVVAS